MAESAFGIEHVHKAFSESKDRQKVTYKDKKGGKTTYKVKRRDTDLIDQASHAANHFAAGGSMDTYSALPGRSFTLNRDEGHPRPLKGAKSAPLNYKWHETGTAPTRANVYRRKEVDRQSDRKWNAAAGGAAGGVTGGFVGAATGSAKGAAIGAAGGAAAGTAAGAAYRPPTHKLVGAKKKKKVQKSAFDVDHTVEKAFGGAFKMPKMGGPKMPKSNTPPNAAANAGYRAGRKVNAGANKVAGGFKAVGNKAGQGASALGAKRMGSAMQNNPGKAGSGIIGGGGLLTGGIYANRKNKKQPGAV